jgi:hypothetical protein
MSWEAATILCGGIATLAIYSFLFGENPFYRVFEHLFIGIAAGFVPILTIKNFLWPNVLEPMLGFSVMQYPDGTYAQPYQPLYLLYLVPLLFGLLYYALYIPRYAWLAKLVIGFSLGYTAGLTFKGFFAEMIPQVVGSFKPLVVFEGSSILIWQSLSNALFVYTLVAVLAYFFFTFKQDGPILARVRVSGRWLMMICFGAFFGSTIMARMALLVERLQFLLGEWAEQISNLLT